MKVGEKAVFQVSNPITLDYLGGYVKADIRPKLMIYLHKPETSLHKKYYQTLI